MGVPPERQKADENSLQGATEPHLAGEGQNRDKQDDRAGRKSGGHAAIASSKWEIGVGAAETEEVINALDSAATGQAPDV
jgi:hypothetical protein